MRGGINPGDIRVRFRVVGVVSELCMYVWMDYGREMGPYRPQMTVTVRTIPGQ